MDTLTVPSQSSVHSTHNSKTIRQQQTNINTITNANRVILIISMAISMERDIPFKQRNSIVPSKEITILLYRLTYILRYG